jgi:hypothetical protein
MEDYILKPRYSEEVKKENTPAKGKRIEDKK